MFFTFFFIFFSVCVCRPGLPTWHRSTIDPRLQMHAKESKTYFLRHGFLLDKGLGIYYQNHKVWDRSREPPANQVEWDFFPRNGIFDTQHNLLTEILVAPPQGNTLLESVRCAPNIREVTCLQRRSFFVKNLKNLKNPKKNPFFSRKKNGILRYLWAWFLKSSLYRGVTKICTFWANFQYF